MKRKEDACIICTGQIQYDASFEKSAEALGEYEFNRYFKLLSKHLNDADLVIGNLATMSSQKFPGITEVSLEYRKTHGYSNCKPEFIKTLSKVGIDCIAAANIYTAGMGIEGVLDTERIITDNNMICSGIGVNKNPIIEVNGIKLAILSTTIKCINYENKSTEKDDFKFINIFDVEEIRKTIEQVREEGAEFVLVYVNCGNANDKLNYAGRKNIGEKISEMGADYVVCTVPKILSPGIKYITSDGRETGISISLGSFFGASKNEEQEKALLRLYLRRDDNGKVIYEDSIIPIKPVLNRMDNYTAQLTIKDIYETLGKKPSRKDLKAFGKSFEEPVSCITARKTSIKPGCAVVLHDYSGTVESDSVQCTIEDCIKSGVSLVIDNKPHEEIPCITVKDDLRGVFVKLMRRIKAAYKPVTVAITGSMGKTTTKEMAAKVFETQYKTLHVSGNYNTVYTIGQVVQSLEKNDGAYIQEVSGGSLGTASLSSQMINPDICIITNIERNHIEVVGTFEKLIECKLGITDGLKEGGVLIINNDNEILKKIDLPVRTIRYGLTDDKCHYYAKNIHIKNNKMHFDIVSKNSEFDDAGVYPAVLQAYGEHNVSNALAVFAAGRQAGISAHKIVTGLAYHQTSGIRQNVIEHGGIKMIIDVYNSNPTALIAMFKVFEHLEPAENGRKIAVLGMMGEQGNESKQIHYEAGKMISEFDFDLLLCFGEDAEYMAKGAAECGRDARWFDTRKSFNDAVSQNIRTGDVVIFKASHFMNFKDETIVPIFGKLGGTI